MPLLKKKVTCGYFSVSAARSWVSPAAATTWPRLLLRGLGAEDDRAPRSV
jgi:hypothetical protein